MLSHRVVWSLLFLLVVLALRRQWGWLRQLGRKRRMLSAFFTSSVLLAINWLMYIWAITHGHVIDASLGYFITPLISVALGCTVLHERLRRPQWLALSLALFGVVWLTVEAGHLPWIPLVLASSFGAYGLLRKVATLGALEGLTLETLMLTPAAVGALAWFGAHGVASFPAPDIATNLWLIGVGPTTAIPLLLFAAAARRLSLATLGIVQYVSPTLQFILGAWFFHEPFSSQRLIGFAFIWIALLLYSLDGWRASRRSAVGPAVALG